MTRTSKNPAHDQPAPPLDSERVTLADVARKSGVGIPTVSKVLNDRPNCWASEETRQRIREAAEALGYRPNLSARALRSGRSHVIGFVSPGFQAGSAHTRPGGLTDAAAETDYTVTVASHPNDSAAEDHVILRLLDRAVDGLAIYPVDAGPHKELRALVARGFPVVTFEGVNLLDFECDDVSIDHRAVGRLQARHLLDLGRRRICIAKALPEARINVIRDEGICMELARAGMPAPVAMNIHRSADKEITEPDATYEGVRAFVRKHAGEFDAVISYDSVAALAVRALLEHGLRVPEDVAVIGAGDGPIAGYATIPLTSVSTQDDWAGAKAFELLLDRIGGRRTGKPFRRLTSTAKLIVRQSTRG